MNVLLSAYACEPNKGSEPGVGWHWAVEIAKKGHTVWVITRANNRQSIENFMKRQNLCLENLQFIYFDLPVWVQRLKRGLQGVHWYYFLWQLGAFFKAKQLCETVSFDRVHHITFVSARQPSFMGLLGKPFIFGPLAGGEKIPWHLRKNLPLHGQIRDFLRDIVNTVSSWDPFMKLAFRQADAIYTTSLETLRILPREAQQKAVVQLAIGVDTRQDTLTPRELNCNEGIRFLYAGNLLYLKGIHLALKAFAEFQKHYPNSRFTIIGEGSDFQWLSEMATDLSIQDSLDWVGKMPQSELADYYLSHDIFLFPSLRDSGGMVVLEALSYGLPVICLGLGGPASIVDESCGAVVDVQGLSENQIVGNFTKKMLTLVQQSPVMFQGMRQSAYDRAARFSWANIVGTIYPADVSR